jgi:hypothetical protein
MRIATQQITRGFNHHKHIGSRFGPLKLVPGNRQPPIKPGKVASWAAKPTQGVTVFLSLLICDYCRFSRGRKANINLGY